MKPPWLFLCVLALPAIAADKGAVPDLPPPIPLPKSVLPKKPNLPVLGRPGAQEAARLQNVVHLGSGANEVVYVSSVMPNRISTPFANPVVVDNGDEEFSHKVIGQDVYFTWTKKAPLGIFVHDASRPTGNVASLTLVPQEIPGQNIVLMFDQPAPTVARGEDEGKGVPADYVDELRIAMRALAMNAAPAGYAEGVLAVGATRVGALTVIPERQFIGSRWMLYRYRVENASKETVELSEPAFFDRGVRAVAFWPSVRLEPSAATFAFIAAEYPGHGDGE